MVSFLMVSIIGFAKNKSSKNVPSLYGCKLNPDSPTKGLYQYTVEMKKMIFFAALSILLYATGCQADPDPSGGSDKTDDISQQLLNQEHVTGGLHPFELIENPVYSPVYEIETFNDNDMVFVTRASGDVQVFPHRHMHVEVVNEAKNGVWMAITYCPITRSGINWNRVVGNDTLLLTASGYLYKENMMPLDVHSGSIWSQMLLRRFQGAVNQEEIFAFREIATFPLIETTWKTVKENFPEAGVYINNSPLKSVDSNPLEQQMGIISKEAVEIFTPDMFPGETTLHVTAVNPWGMIVVVGSTLYHYMVAFRTSYAMEPVQGEFPVIMKDETGTFWNIFGEGVNGEHNGEKLESPLYFTAADWAWRDLYDQLHEFEP